MQIPLPALIIRFGPESKGGCPSGEIPRVWFPERVAMNLLGSSTDQADALTDPGCR
jgi:hypothetical protein